MNMNEKCCQDVNGNNLSEKEQELLKRAQKYDGMSEASLFDELISNVDRAKNAGDFDYGQLLEFANTMFPYLNEEQQGKLIDLLKVIRQK